MIFLVCVMFHPEIQQKIHEELERVVGDDRLPTHEDRESLQYLRAAWREASRWRPTAPISTQFFICRHSARLILSNPSDFPHVTTEDQVNQGYWIPKGSLIFTNTG